MCTSALKRTNAEWLKVGPDSYGKTIGWLPASCTTDWKMQLTLAFTNPANRDRLLFFKDRATVEGILDAPDPVSKVAPLRATLKKGQQAPGVLAEEPEYFVDLQKQFYLLPVLSGEEVMTESGFRTRLLNVASVSKPDDKNAKGGAANSAAGGKEAEDKTANQLKEFSAAVVFVIDSTISMDPYIDRTREAIRKVYQRIEAQNLGKQVKFGLVAFRSNTQAVPGLEYTTKMYADPTKVKDSADFFAKIADLKQATVSSSSFDEDAFAGVMDSIDKVDWSQFGARYVVLITDAGAIEGDDKLSKTGLSAAQVRMEAANPGVAIYTLHLKTPAGAKDHAKAEAQYQNLSTYPGTNTSLYYPVNAGDIHEFGRKVDALAAAITYSGESRLHGRRRHRQCGERQAGPGREENARRRGADRPRHATRLSRREDQQQGPAGVQGVDHRPRPDQAEHPDHRCAGAADQVTAQRLERRDEADSRCRQRRPDFADGNVRSPAFGRCDHGRRSRISSSRTAKPNWRTWVCSASTSKTCRIRAKC